MTSSCESVPIPVKKNKIPLLTQYYGNYFYPLNWELTPKSRNYIAKITKGDKNPFKRKFLHTTKLDDQIVFVKKDFQEGEIIEQKCVYIKGSKQENIFHGFFIIHHEEGQIYGEKISQKDALEYFDCKDLLPDPEIPNAIKNRLRTKLGTVIRQLSQKYGKDLIADVLADILQEYFPNV